MKCVSWRGKQQTKRDEENEGMKGLISKRSIRSIKAKGLKKRNKAKGTCEHEVQR